MKLLLIDVNCKDSSTGNIVYDLYTSVNESGHEAKVCYGRGTKLSENGIYKFGIDIETKIHALLTRLTGFTGCFSYFSTRRLLKFIEDYKPDVIHIHELHAYFVNIKPLINYIKKKNIKTVFTFHCEFMYTGKCGHSYECTNWKTFCHKCPHLLDYPKTLFFDHTKYMFNQKKELFSNWNNLLITTPSSWLENRVKQSFLKDKNIQVIHNGIDSNIFYPRKTEDFKRNLNINPKTKIVLSLAPNLLSDAKGGKDVLQIAKKLKEKDIMFILIGVDEKNVGESDNTIIKPRIYDKNQLAKYYSVADLFCICSKKENYPTVCLEALSCGTPVVGYDTGGTKETAPYPYGEFVDYGDIEGLSNLIEKKLIEKNYINDEFRYQLSNSYMNELYKEIYLK